MKLKEALDAFYAGKGIRRKFWVEYGCNEKYNYLTDSGLAVHCLRDDICADDWEIEPDKKGQLKEKIKNLISVFDNSYDIEDAPYTGNYEKDLFDFIENLEIK